MKKGRGRTSRRRRRKLRRSSESRGVNESCKPEFIELQRWLKDRKFEGANLVPASFPGTGRGLMSTAPLQEGQVILSLPESCLLTTDTVMRSYLGAYVAKAFFSSLQPLFSEAVEGVFSYSAFLWAWGTVNTRAVYLARGRRPCFSAEPDTCALAPYLDLLNHSPAVQVDAAFNEGTRCYEIRTGSRWGPREEVLICYGPHDNQRLLLEYGFVPPRNPHACVHVAQDVLVQYLPAADKQTGRKSSILEDHGFTENLTFGWDGPSWRLLTALKLLCLRAEEFPRWKKVLLGETVSDANEKTSLDVAQKICRHLIEETDAVLQKVSRMKAKETALVTQLTLVETLRTEELKVLQASADILHRLLAASA
ncbi:SET domain containing 4 [Phyllostomus discolor]|uniref:SET domain containing 4 n=1 Tax=Phyllostomus discolor TaxID=89673 RepID=A0A834B2E4_9CHIR|nr:SET domain containing 4 [Phyllostomus discolor]